MKPIKSSNLKEADYDPKTGKLQVRFKSGALYESEGKIAPELYKRFAATFQANESSTAFYNKHLRALKFKKI